MEAQPGAEWRDLGHLRGAAPAARVRIRRGDAGGGAAAAGSVVQRERPNPNPKPNPNQVRQPWEQQYNSSGLQPSGVPGARMEEKHVLTGAVLPFWGAISQACARHVHGMCTACARHRHGMGMAWAQHGHGVGTSYLLRLDLAGGRQQAEAHARWRPQGGLCHE